MTIGLLFVIVFVVGAAIVLAWTFQPTLRDKMKGWSTVVEALGGIVYWAMDKVTGGVQDAVAAGYIPAWLVGYVPILMLVWFLIKRFDTTGPVGVKPDPAQ